MTKHEDNLINVLKGALKGRDNPIDLKPVYIGKIVNLSPIKVSIFDGKVILTEDNDLYISEQFRFACFQFLQIVIGILLKSISSFFNFPSGSKKGSTAASAIFSP